jgi:phosphoribosylaminoimidazolecarboxamide formyltransferase/IMP cyclohydrolase
VHAGILADLRLPDHVRQLEELGIAPFELVVVNLYPFEQTVASGARPTSASSRSTSAGRRWSARRPRTTPRRRRRRAGAYAEVLAAVATGGTTLEQRKRLAGRAFAHTAAYDTAVASWFSSSYAPADEERFPAFLGATWERKEVLRYGENPHQGAALYVRPGGGDSLATAEQLHGKAMSYNNYVDTDAALRAAHDFADPCVAIVKHANPCGIAVGPTSPTPTPRPTPATRCRRSAASSPTNRPVSLAMAQQVAEVFTEVVVAPAYEDGAVELLSRKPSIRLLVTQRLAEPRELADRRRVLLQARDLFQAPGDDPATWTLAPGTRPTRRCSPSSPSPGGRCARSRATHPARPRRGDGQVGMGQVNRVDAARLAVPAPGSAPQVGRGLRRVLPVPRRAAGPARRRGARRRPAGRVGARRGGRGRGAGRRRDAVPHWHPHFAH